MTKQDEEHQVARSIQDGEDDSAGVNAAAAVSPRQAAAFEDVRALAVISREHQAVHQLACGPK
jgi:hypothetical protein